MDNLPFGERPAEPTARVEPGTVSRTDLIASVRDAELRRDLANADILFVPDSGHAGHVAPMFPQGTMEVLRLFKDTAPAGVVADIATSDDDYRELALHAAEIVLPALLVSAVLTPIAINLLSSYLYDLLKDAVARRKARVRATIYVEASARSVTIRYDGPAEQFSEVVTAAFNREVMEPPGQAAAVQNIRAPEFAPRSALPAALPLSDTPPVRVDPDEHPSHELREPTSPPKRRGH